jgi:hypothetical protein
MILLYLGWVQWKSFKQHMVKQIYNWYKKCKPLQRLLITLIFWCLFWTLSEFVLMQLWPDEPLDSVGSYIFTGIFMGILWTCSFEWKLVKEVFRNTNKNAKSS